MTGGPAGMVGSDPDQLESLARSLTKSATQLRAAEKAVGSLVKTTAWHGPKANAFKGQWNGGTGAGICRAADQLDRMAANVQGQAYQQREASAPGGSAGKADWDDPERTTESKPWFWVFNHDVPVDHGLKRFPPDGLDMTAAPTDVVQGALGDCYLAAALAAIATTPDGAARLESMITRNDDGTFTVRFPDGTSETVDADFYVKKDDGEVAYGHGPDGQPNWYSVIEKAYAQRNDGYDDIGDGGWTHDIFEELGYGDDHIDGTDATEPNKIWDMIHTATEGGRPATVSMNSDTFDGLDSGGHALTVIDTYESGDDRMVRIRNPWGYVGFEEEIRAAGGRIGSPDDGTFEISVEDLARISSGFAVG